MTLLVTIIAAVVSTAVWYSSERARRLKVGTLMYLYWGASLMWLVDAAVEYIEAGAVYFMPSSTDMLNDLFLGLAAAALGLVIWTVTLLIKDPDGIIKAVHENKR